MSDDRNAVDKAVEKATGEDEVGEAVDEAIDEGPSRDHAEKKPASPPPDRQRRSEPGAGDEE